MLVKGATDGSCQLGSRIGLMAACDMWVQWNAGDRDLLFCEFSIFRMFAHFYIGKWSLMAMQKKIQIWMSLKD